jgi:diphosphomevalonate decarboxylase
MSEATARAHPNIAFIKYWGNQDHTMRLPSNSSLSMNLDGLHTETHLRFDPDLNADQFILNGQPQSGKTLQRLSEFLKIVRTQASLSNRAFVESSNNFPMGAGIASSSSAFAALALAASKAAGLTLNEKELSRLARRGSGSASRSIPAGFVEWHASNQDENSFAESISDPSHWSLVDCIAVISEEHKETGSTDGHLLADSSPLQTTRVQGAQQRLRYCKEALLSRDFDAFAEIVELDSNLMHAVMMSSRPPLLYWQPATVSVIQQVRNWRTEGLSACTTIDAGPNVHVLCPSENSSEIEQRLAVIPGVKTVLSAKAGGPATLIS